MWIYGSVSTVVLATTVLMVTATLGPNRPIQQQTNNNDCPTVSSLLQAVGFAPTCVSSSLALCSAHNGEDEFTNSLQAIHEGMTQVREAINELNTWQSRPRHCKDLLASGDSGRGIRKIFPYPERPYYSINVVCEQNVDGGGWTVFQHRTSAITTREDFYRTWVEYKMGFGNLDGEFWLGLNHIHILTSGSLQQFRVDLADFDGGQRFAKYGAFYVGTESDSYRLSIDRYSGDAGDSLTVGGHNGMKFSTHDADHDTSSDSCSQKYRGAWWYASCHRSNLNGYQYEGQHESFADGINWYEWRGHHYSLMNTTLMIKPAF